MLPVPDQVKASDLLVSELFQVPSVACADEKLATKSPRIRARNFRSDALRLRFLVRDFVRRELVFIGICHGRVLAYGDNTCMTECKRQFKFHSHV